MTPSDSELFALFLPVALSINDRWGVYRADLFESVPWEGVGRRTLVGPGKGAVLESLPRCYQLHIEDSLLDISGYVFLPKNLSFVLLLDFFFFLLFFAPGPTLRAY